MPRGANQIDKPAALTSNTATVAAAKINCLTLMFNKSLSNLITPPAYFLKARY